MTDKRVETPEKSSVEVLAMGLLAALIVTLAVPLVTPVEQTTTAAIPGYGATR